MSQSQDNPSIQWSTLEQWIQKFAPRVYFHHDEVFFDEDASNYVNDPNVGLFTATECTEGKNKGKPTIDPQQVEKNEQNLSSSENTKHNSYLGLIDANPKSSAFSETTHGTSGPFDTCKCYVHVLAINGYIELQYFLFSPFNGGTTVRFEAGWFGSDATASMGNTGIGSHQGDWEHITVRISMTGEFIATWYSQHSVGEWRSPETTPFAEGSHPVVYCAKRTHASYPSAGLHKIYDKGPYKTVIDPTVHVPLFNITVGVCDTTEDADDPNYGPWDTWKGNGGDGVLGPNLCVLEVDGLNLSDGAPPAAPGWFNFGGRWGGPFPAKYSFGELHSIGASLVVAFSKANPIVAAGILAIVSYILAALAAVVSGPIAASIAAAFALGGFVGVVTLILPFVVAIGIVYGLILAVISDLIARGNTTFGPERVQDKAYWTAGEKIPYSTAPQHMMNGSTDVTMMFSPSLAVSSSITTTVSDHYENDQLLAFYCDRSNNLFYETSESFGTKWNPRHKATSNNAHSSPAAVFHLNENKGWAQTYVFYQRKDESISYSHTDNPADKNSWTDGDVSGTDDKTMLYNSGLSAAVMDDKMYVVYRDAHEYFVMVCGTINQESGNGITDWSFVTPNCQTSGNPLELGVMDAIPYIVTTDDGNLLLSYSISGQPYLRECYWKVVEPDGNGDGDKTTHQLTWGQPSALSTDNLMAGSSAQPVIVDGITYLIYGATNPPDGALSNIYYVIATPDDRPEQGTDPRMYTISRSASLGVNMSTDRNLGLAAGIDGSIHLQIRKEDTKLLYFASATPYIPPPEG
jgi:hypothetical protein